MNETTKYGLFFVGGVLVGALGAVALTRGKLDVKPLATDLLSSGIDLKDKLMAGVDGVREDLADVMAEALKYLEDGMPAEAVFYEGRAISIELPTILVREVTYTEPAVKGDTSGKVMKPAKLATGFELAVPAFVNTGDKIEIDTRTSEYRNRVK